jgi:hypothetical protein
METSSATASVLFIKMYDVSGANHGSYVYSVANNKIKCLDAFGSGSVSYYIIYLTSASQTYFFNIDYSTHMFYRTLLQPLGNTAAIVNAAFIYSTNNFIIGGSTTYISDAGILTHSYTAY